MKNENGREEKRTKPFLQKIFLKKFLSTLKKIKENKGKIKEII
jgi:hypothetical protein